MVVIFKYCLWSCLWCFGSAFALAISRLGLIVNRRMDILLFSTGLDTSHNNFSATPVSRMYIVDL